MSSQESQLDRRHLVKHSHMPLLVAAAGLNMLEVLAGSFPEIEVVPDENGKQHFLVEPQVFQHIFSLDSSSPEVLERQRQALSCIQNDIGHLLTFHTSQLDHVNKFLMEKELEKQGVPTEELTPEEKLKLVDEVALYAHKLQDDNRVIQVELLGFQEYFPDILRIIECEKLEYNFLVVQYFEYLREEGSLPVYPDGDNRNYFVGRIRDYLQFLDELEGEKEHVAPQNMGKWLETKKGYTKMIFGLINGLSEDQKGVELSQKNRQVFEFLEKITHKRSFLDTAEGFSRMLQKMIGIYNHALKKLSDPDLLAFFNNEYDVNDFTEAPQQLVRIQELFQERLAA
jgi:hypothetical protein